MDLGGRRKSEEREPSTIAPSWTGGDWSDWRDGAGHVARIPWFLLHRQSFMVNGCVFPLTFRVVREVATTCKRSVSESEGPANCRENLT